MKNIPNILSTIRILMVPVFVLVFFHGGEHAMLWAAFIFLMAALTDFLDGYIARRFDYISNLGKILDPAGDKLMILAMVTCLSVRDVIPDWIPWFFLIKEMLMASGGLFINRKICREMPASNMIGKTATFVLFCVGVVLMVFEITPLAAELMISAAVILTFAAFVSYIIMFAGLWKKHKAR